MFGFTHNERWLTSSLSHTHSRILHRSSMKLYLLSLSTGWQCMEVRLPCALCEMEQSLATSDHTVIPPPISCFHDHSGLHLLVPITFNHSSTQEQVLPSRAADTCTVCLSCRVFVHKRICLKCKLPLFCTTALPCLACLHPCPSVALLESL